jgi:2'-5' RNA ligase
MRCFIAVVFSPEIDARIANIQSQLQDTLDSMADTTSTNHFHITLSFLGDIPDKDVETLKEQISGLKCKALSLQTNNVMLFPNKRHPRVVSLGFKQDKNASELAKTQLLIKSALISQIKKVNTNKNSFIPHITLFRIKSLKSSADELIQACTNTPIERMTLKTQKLVLFKSTLDPNGPIYEPLAEVPFQ